MKPGLSDLIMLSALFVAVTARSETVRSGCFTNTSGEVTVGEVIGVTNRLVTLRMGRGMVRAIPLRTFPAGEQERLLLAAGASLPLPADLEQRFRYLRDLCVRADRLRLAKKLSPEKADQRKQELCAAWQRSLQDAFVKGQISTALHTQWSKAPLQ